ncbi:hypothetical protein GDO86_010271 [Hymenochirus boettgeri]|uniref:APC membrane recruitment protein 3 n=1 Tax=Hymenochirus boettgeri TaxID=247094 RepID=A0A8T2JNT1_9PIPI|nr:hypothetical protein GDO86_010271 [Hymenochirus boettgeri]
MELIRGKTFIKNYPQNPPEKLPSIGVPEKKNEKKYNERNVSPCLVNVNASSTNQSLEQECLETPDNNFWSTKFVKKSKTHDCVMREAKTDELPSASRKVGLPSSRSFSGFENRNGKGNGDSTVNQQIIDYRNFVPQLPFVPSVAKAFPRKRISLKRPKKGLKSIFHMKRNKQQEMGPIAEKNKSHQVPFQREEGRKVNANLMYSDEFLVNEASDNELYIDTIDFCHKFCEDVASLKSFDSFTGCGEIFADESSTYLNMDFRKDGHKLAFIAKDIPKAGNFQGGVEKLASPAKSESIDFTRLRGHINNSSRHFCSVAQVDSKLPSNSNSTSCDIPKDPSLDSPSNDLASPHEMFADAGSPVSTSDEGYYDSSSPGDDEKKEKDILLLFPRDSYSGDALYELFCDSSEPSPSFPFGGELSISGHSSDNPRSIYSFCVGSEENMVFQSTDDLDGDCDQQSSWKGRECLMKLCDTELSLTMGMVNWLRKTGNMSEPPVASQNSFSTDQFNHADAPSKSQSTGKCGNKTTSICNGKCQAEIKNETKQERQLVNDVCHYQQNHNKLDGVLPGYKLWSPSSKAFLTHKPLVLQTLINNEENYRNELESYNSCIKKLGNINITHLLSTSNILPSPITHSQNLLHPFGLQYITGCMKPSLNENDQTVIKMLERCAKQIASLNIMCREQSKEQESVNGVMQCHEVSQNIKNYIERQNYSPKHTNYPALSYISESKETNQQSESFQLANCNDNSKINDECNELGSPVFVGRPRFLPYFRSQCSSLISTCSSAWYKIHNSRESLLLINTPSKSSNPNEIPTESIHASRVLDSEMISKSKGTELFIHADFLEGKVSHTV